MPDDLPDTNRRGDLTLIDRMLLLGYLAVAAVVVLTMAAVLVLS